MPESTSKRINLANIEQQYTSQIIPTTKWSNFSLAPSVACGTGGSTWIILFLVLAAGKFNSGFIFRQNLRRLYCKIIKKSSLIILIYCRFSVFG